jgi:predicted amidohydrolase
MKKSVTVGLIQMHCSASREDNLKRALKKIEEAAAKGANIVCLPELFESTYFCQKKDDKAAFLTAEAIPGATTKTLSEVARRLKIVLVGGSIFEKAPHSRGTALPCPYYNTSPVFGPDGALLGTYRKTHIPEDPLYHEQHYFAPGDTGVKVFETPFGKIAVLICFDQWFPEAARIAALQGAEIIVYPTAIANFIEEETPEGNVQDAWEAVQRGHAIANNVFVAAVNRVGTEGNLKFFGGSFVSDAFGNTLAHAGHDEEILLAECNLSMIPEVREGWGFFRNRRPECYGKIAENFQ